MLRNIIVSEQVKDYLGTFTDQNLVDISYIRIQLHEKAHRIWANLNEAQRKAYSQISWAMDSWKFKKALAKIPNATAKPEQHFIIQYPFGSSDSSEEDFTDHVSAYVLFGPQFRAEAQKYPDIAAKYGFIRETVFGGVEYEKNYDFEKAIADLAMNVQGEVKVVKTRAPAAIEISSKNLGGIDLNPKNIHLERQGQRIKIQFPKSLQNYEGHDINGFVPVIINVTPISNIPLLLGLSSEK